MNPLKVNKKFKTDSILTELSQINGIKSVLADSSSLIYLKKLNLIGNLGQAIKIITITEVISELGPAFIVIPGLQILAPLADDPSYQNLPTDKKLLAQAISGHYCILADDRRILRAGLEAGLKAHATLIMVLLLYFRGCIDLPSYQLYRDQLADFARYDRKLIAYADELCFMFGKYF